MALLLCLIVITDGCVKFVKNMLMLMAGAKVPFSTRPCANTTHPTHSFMKHTKWKRHVQLEEKIRKDAA